MRDRHADGVRRHDLRQRSRDDCVVSRLRRHRSSVPITESHVPQDLDRPTLFLHRRQPAILMAIRSATPAARRAARRAANRPHQSLALALAKAMAVTLGIVLLLLTLLSRVAHTQ